MLNKSFIKQNIPLNAEFSYNSPAIRFRKKFNVESVKKTTLYVCGLGYGYYYINGKPVSDNLLSAPVSDYTKTVWYLTYDITPLLKKGENTFSAILGNGWLNENFKSGWDHNKAQWRDNPKLYAEIKQGKKDIMLSDESFKVKEDKCIYFNQLRSGEYWNYNFIEDWTNPDFDDSKWENAIVDNSLTGELIECKCEPIRICGEFKTQRIIKRGDDYVFDLGQNIAGFVRLKGTFAKNQEITLIHAETIDETGNVFEEDGITFFNNLNAFTKDVPFQTDKVIGNGKYIEWSPLFTYHGFRYVYVKGLKEEPTPDMITGLFVHNDVKRASSFSSDNQTLNKIYNLGIMSTWSNMCYSLTDCPTREKLGWLNDAAASIDQVLLNFSSEKFIEKWIKDIFDTEKENGDVSGIAPSDNWGYNCGAVCTIAIAEIPFALYLKTLDKRIAKISLPYIEKHLKYYESTLKDDGTSMYWLGDWTGIRSRETPIPMIEKSLVIRFLRVIKEFKLALSRSARGIDEKIEKYKKKIEKEYVKDGYSVYNNQTATSILIMENIGDKEKLAKQLVEVVEKNPVVDCGMIGIQYLYSALSKIGRPDLVVKMLSNKDNFYSVWFKDGATTLYESFDDNPYTKSKNHHMFSNVTSWFFRNLAGIKYDNFLGINKITVSPEFNSGVNELEASIDLPTGSIAVSFDTAKNYLNITVTGNIDATYLGKKLEIGKNEFKIKA